MKNKKTAVLITALSLLACILHALLLNVDLGPYAVTSALKVGLFAALPIAYILIGKKGNAGQIKSLFFVKAESKSIRLCLGLALMVFGVLMIAFVILSPFLEKEMIVEGLSQTGINGGNFPFVFAYIVLINAATEELFFRGFVFLMLFKAGYKAYAFVYSSLLFSLYHVFIINDLMEMWIFAVLMAGLVCAGLIFNELTRRCNSIFGSLIVHISANLAINMIGVHYFYVV